MTLQQCDFSFPEPFYPNITHLFYNFYFGIRKKNLICVKTKKVARKVTFLSLPLYKLLILPKDYYSTLEKQGIHLHRCEVLVAYDILIVINREKGLVHRCSYNENGYKAAKNNYTFLKTSGFDRCPEAVSISEINGNVISTERLLKGRFLRVEELNDNIINELFCNLKKLYLKDIVCQRFNLEREFERFDSMLEYYPSKWVDMVLAIKTKIKKMLDANHSEDRVYKTMIHGDLTYRNVLMSAGKPMYIDFDRAEISYPEFDFYSFVTDLETHKTGVPTFELFFDNIFKLINNKSTASDTIDYYGIFCDFKANKAFELEIKLLFMYRIVVLLLQYLVGATKKVAEDILTHVNNKLEKCVYEANC
jgi:thiamine kinase-like enzyme